MSVVSKQSHILFTTAEFADVDVVLMQQFQMQVAKWSRLFQYPMRLVSITAPGHDGGQVVAGVVGGISEVAADDHRGVIKQGAVTFLDLIQVGKGTD